ncbi:DUF5941 domain-containing protein [Actinomadura syzygii]|uniref:DUF5941 domain-containing protein n=1 Tax=Actinomadura syzygii TaxID=1427538 RepID=UPI001651B1C4|nr:DUF5941 domain-containing protein [Actinomadura syzygii]
MEQAPPRARPVHLNVPDHQAGDPADGLLGGYAARPCARVAAEWAARRGLGPDALAATSFAAAGLAAVWFSAGTRGGLLTGGLLLCASVVLGAAPGAGHEILDAGKELAVYAGLAAGGAASGEHVWWAATGAAALLSVRTTLDATSPPRPSRRGGLARRAAATLRLPVAERSALLAAATAVADVRTAFTLLTAWGTVVALGTLAVRALTVPAHAAAVRAHRDDGPASLMLGLAARGRLAPLPGAVLAAAATGVLLAARPDGGPAPALFAPAVALMLVGPSAAHPHDGRLDRLVPPITRGIEYGYLAVLGFAQAVPAPLVYVSITVLALHHHDIVRRVRRGRPPQEWVPRAGLGWEGRLLVAAVAALAGPLTFAYAALAAYLGVLFGGEAAVAWTRSRRTRCGSTRTRRHDDGVTVDREEERA